MKKQLLLATTLLAVSGVVFAGGRSSGQNLSDVFLKDQTESIQPSSGGSAMMTMLENDEFCEIPAPESRSLILTREINASDPGTFTSEQLAVVDQDFSFKKTLDQIIATSGSSSTTATELLVDIYDSLDESSITEGGNTFALQVRNQEADQVGLADLMLLRNDIEFSALVNRFDLASSTGEHCGEYRIVYHTNNINEIGGIDQNRFFFIFEAMYPNPWPSRGVAGCVPVANFWLSLDGLSKAEAAEKLKAFYYDGVVSDGILLPPVVNFAAYSENAGQVRTNAFIDRPWNLREFKTAIDTETNKTIFEVESVKSNPLAELFSGTSLTSLDAQFAQEFSSIYVNNLIQPELDAIAAGIDLSELSALDIINGVHLSNDEIFDEFQSDADFDSLIPDNTAGRAMSSAISNAYDNALTLLPEGYTVSMLRNRAEAMSCGGCHQNVANAEIAPGVRWPATLSFVHIHEDGRISSGLRDQFLPHRAEILANFSCNTPKLLGEGPVTITHKALGLSLTEEATCETTSDSGDPVSAVQPNSITACGTWILDYKDDGHFFLKNAVSNRPVSPETDGLSVEPVMVTPHGWNGDWVTWFYVPVEDDFGFIRHKMRDRPLFMPGDGSNAAMVGGHTWTGDWVRWNISPAE